MLGIDTLRQVPAFSGLSNDSLRWLIEEGTETWLQPGEVLRREGEPAEQVFVLLGGEFHITQRVGEREVVLKVHDSKAIFGEVPHLMGVSHYWASGRAITACHILELSKDVFWQLLSICPTLTTSILRTMSDRLQEVQVMAKYREQLVSLGTLAAGLAHELNNPAAAGRQAARQLREVFPLWQQLTLQLSQKPMTDEQRRFLATLQQEAISQAQEPPTLSPLVQSDREDELTDWLQEHHVANPWQLAPTFVGFGLSLDWFNNLATRLPGHCLSNILAWLETGLTVAGLLKDLQQSTGRISLLANAVEDRTESDSSPELIDIHDGIENALLLLEHKLTGITIIRDYDSLPPILAYDKELKQVWTHLVDNAVDAMAIESNLSLAALTIPTPWQEQQITRKAESTIWLRTRLQNEHVLVEIADNGAGIPNAVQPHIFEPFFTTKQVSQGTGIGLPIVRRIVVEKHQGDVRVSSQPGYTCFQVRLPLAR